MSCIWLSWMCCAVVEFSEPCSSSALTDSSSVLMPSTFFFLNKVSSRKCSILQLRKLCLNLFDKSLSWNGLAFFEFLIVFSIIFVRSLKVWFVCHAVKVMEELVIKNKLLIGLFQIFLDILYWELILWIIVFLIKNLQILVRFNFN